MRDLTLEKVTDVIGLEIYSFLHPRDLFSLSSTTHCIFDGIRKNLMQVALRQLPLILDDHLDRMEYRVIASNVHSFPSREKLLSHVLEKVETAELNVAGLTLEESLIIAREVLNNEKKPGVYGATLMSPTTDRFPDPEYTHVGYNYQKENRELAVIRGKDIVERMALMGQESVRVEFVQSWLGYLFAQRKDLVIGSWFWSCRHRNLDFQGVEGKGVMFSSRESPVEELEISFVIMTKSRVGGEEEVTPIVPQFPVATRVESTDTESQVVESEHSMLVSGVSTPLAAEIVTGEPVACAVLIDAEAILLAEENVVLMPPPASRCVIS
ncbi:hypothetical protein HJC23_007808 [Cyclotella cryptica]|uniref:F-box domain-containing protein n=1 Tax=Cyclotella cryptica TaxID=29204 RepID=A0ABD3QZZ4_9STRA|eukprot:CCRYP_000102-RA/>CCRYP_000102-RA protein AED:0.00 eAED:0.00 QI:249/-1/1/1/-1/1/1/408/324